MYIPFNDLPDSARVWIYQSNREFNKEELNKINETLKEFNNTWNNHGEGLKSSFIVKYNRFIVLGIDENYHEASGCSIDSSVQVMKKIESEFDVELFDRMKTAFKVEENINIVSLADFQKYIKEDKINQDTIVFNNMVETVGDFKSKWEVSAKNSWHSRFFV